MMDNLAPIMTSLTALVAVGITFAIARRIFTGQLTPLEVRQLVDKQDEQIVELRRQNVMLREELDTLRNRVIDALNEATKATFQITTWLTRYEDRGGFAVAPKPAARADPQAPGG